MCLMTQKKTNQNKNYDKTFMSVVGTEPRGLPYKINTYFVAIELYHKPWWYKPSLQSPATQEPETGDAQVTE